MIRITLLLSALASVACQADALTTAMPDALVGDAQPSLDMAFGDATPEIDASIEPLTARAIATCFDERGWFITIKFDRFDPGCADDIASGEFIELPLHYIDGGQTSVPGDATGYYFGRGEFTADIEVAPFQLNLFDDDIVPWTEDIATTGVVDIQVDEYAVQGPFIALSCPPWRGWDPYPPCEDFPALPD